MAEYLAVESQNVALNSPILFTASIPCPNGNVYHEDETGIFILRGNTNNCFARYQVTYNGNIAVAEGGDVTPIGVAVSVNGEPRISSLAQYTPTETAETNDFGNVTSTAIVTVPRGCCFTLSVRYVDATTDDATVEPTPLITVRNSNIVITRIC